MLFWSSSNRRHPCRFESSAPMSLNRALAVARQGIYAGRTIELAEPGVAERWFDRAADGSYSVNSKVRDLFEFQLQNLVTDEPPFDAGEVDLVVCRNVTIYFGRETTTRTGESLPSRTGRGWLPAARTCRDAVAGQRRLLLGSGGGGVRLPQGRGSGSLAAASRLDLDARRSSPGFATRPCQAWGA